MVSGSVRLLDPDGPDASVITSEHPAVKNIYAKAEAYVNCAGMIDAAAAKEAVRNSIELLDPVRDKDEIGKLNGMI